MKLALLSELRDTEIGNVRQLIAYHEALLFIRAYPDDAEVLERVRRECAGFGDRVDTMRRRDRHGDEELVDSGIARTRLSYWYDFSTVSRLARWYGNALEIAWEEFKDTERLDMLLSLLAGWAENDGLDLADVSTEEWIDLAKGDDSITALQWLLDALHKLEAPFPVKRHLFDALELPIVWELGDSPASRTHARVAHDRPFFHGEPLLRKIGDFRRAITRPLPKMKPADRKTAMTMIKTVSTALAVRHRALYPIEYANPDEVLISDRSRGYRLVILGTQPEYRLPIESDFGALILKNGYIIGYGVGAQVFGQLEIAVNIFDTWRGSEAAHIFAQFIRTFCSHFGCTGIKIVKYQVGHENDEGIKSGAFWFYDKLGFIPKDRDVRDLAKKERRKIRKNRTYRTPIPILKELAESDLYFRIHGDPAGIPEDFPLAELGLQTTRMIAERFDGDRRKAIKVCSGEVAKALNGPRWTAWPAMEREWFKRLSLIVAQIPDLARWTAQQKRALAGIMRAKGGKGETDYVRRMQKHKKLQSALRKIAGAHRE